MYKNEINELMSQKRESLRIIIVDYLNIYFKLKIGFPNLFDERINLTNVIKQYLMFDRNEKEVLNLIKKNYGKEQNIEFIDELLDSFDEIYNRYYEYLEECFKDYESVINDYYLEMLVIDRIKSLFFNKIFRPANDMKFRLILKKINFETFNNDYKEKVISLVRR